MDVLLTNDDGIDAVGLRAAHDALAEVADVTVVAPAADKSAVGRAMSTEVEVVEHELGYAVEGTPADCVVAALESLAPETDLVVAGCNEGANLGAYVLGRSGTVSAAVEAAFFDVPAIATSVYADVGEVSFSAFEYDRPDFGPAVRATRYLARNAVGAGVFERADYLNVNAPRPADCDGDGPTELRVTRPSLDYDMGVERDGDRLTLHDRMWDRMAEGALEGPEDTDRRAVVEGHVSVSPLTAPHTVERHAALDDLAAAYDGGE